MTTLPSARSPWSPRSLRALALFPVLLACGGEPTPPTPAAPAPAPTAPAPVAPAPVAPVAPVAPATAPVGPPVDLLHAAPAAVATSSAYHDDLDQIAALVDGSLETAWNSRTGDLAGAWIEVRVPADATVTSIGMTAGFTHVSPRADLFPGNHRVTRVRVLHDGAEVGTYPLDPELRTLQTLPVAGGGGVYRLEIAEVRPGTNAEWREACVSELVVMGHAPGASGGASAPSTAIGALPALPAAGTSVAAGEHDGVYFVVPEVGFVRLDPRGAWEVVVRDASYSAQPTVDGGWLAREMGVIHQEDGSHFGGPMGSSLTSVDRAPDGTLWATSGGAIARREGTNWVAVERGRSDPFFTHVAVDPSGTVWVGTTTAGLFRLVDGAPSAVELPGGVSVGELDVDPSGRLIVTQADRVLARTGEAWTLLAMGEYTGARVRADGALAALRNGGAEVVVSPGAAPRRIELGPLGVPGDLVRALGWDGAGRLWMDTDAGMVVLEPSLDRLARWYPAGTIDELAGPDGASAIFGIGAGPVLPAAAAPVGVVRGRLLRAGAPVAGAWIEICSRPTARYDDEYGGTPCAPDGDGAERVPHARTGADGTFDFRDVHAEDPGLAIQEEGGPWVIREVECCGDRSRPFDLGTIELP